MGEVYHFSPKSAYSVRNIVEIISKKMGLDFDKVTETVGERLGQDAQYVIDSSKTHSELGWHPEISLDEGLREVINWVDENWQTILSEPLEYIHEP